MIVRHRIFLAIMFLGLAGNLSTAFARGSLGNADPPWNAEHIRGPSEFVSSNPRATNCIRHSASEGSSAAAA
jgi:hypothetical protein